MTALALLRGLHLAAVLSVLGTTAFIAWTLPAAADPRPALPALVRLWRLSGWLALALCVAWFATESAEIADAYSLRDLLDALPVVAGHTRFGHVLDARAVLLLIAVLLAGPSRRRAAAALVATGLAVGLQGAAGHAGASETVSLLVSEWLHLFAAGVWLGGLLPIAIGIARLPATDAGAVCERFTPTGLACVLVLAGTGLLQASLLIGTIPALLGTPYGQFALLKIALFLLALALAAMNRLWLTDRVAGHFPGARAQLRVCVLIEAATGLAIVVAAGFLAALPPGIHQEPVWPLPWQFSLATLRDDADLRQEVIVSVGLIAAAALVLAAMLIRRRYRIAAAAMLGVVAVWGAPSLTLLTATAYPTSFQASPTGFSTASIARGQAVYPQHCVSCHGAGGRGDGPDAAGARITPADLTQPHLWDHPDGELFCWLSHGRNDPRGGLAMPGFAGTLSRLDRWALIDYVRACIAGVALARGASPVVAVPAPELPIRCDGLVATQMADLRGLMVLVVTPKSAGAGSAAPLRPGEQAVIVNRGAQQGNPARGTCVATSPDAPTSYAVLANTPCARLGHEAFLVDAERRLGRLCHVPVELPSGARIIAQDNRPGQSPTESSP